MSPKPPPPLSTHASHLASAEVRAVIAAALHAQHVKAEDIEDLTQDVLVRALALQEPPATLPECNALVFKMAADLAVDRMRARRIRGRFNAGPCENPDDQTAAYPELLDGREALDVKRQLEFARRQIERGVLTGRQAEFLQSDAEGTPQIEIARQFNVGHKTVRNTILAGRHTMRSSWAAYLATAMFAAAGFLVWALRDRARLVASDTNVPDPHPEHDLAPPEPTDRESAAGLRRQALRACAAERWFDCYEGLNEALDLDPAGDQAPWVTQARELAKKHLFTDGKPRMP